MELAFIEHVPSEVMSYHVFLPLFTYLAKTSPKTFASFFGRIHYEEIKQLLSLRLVSKRFKYFVESSPFWNWINYALLPHCHARKSVPAFDQYLNWRMFLAEGRLERENEKQVKRLSDQRVRLIVHERWAMKSKDEVQLFKKIKSNKEIELKKRKEKEKKQRRKEKYRREKEKKEKRKKSLRF
jgi:hypothetical protein